MFCEICHKKQSTIFLSVLQKTSILILKETVITESISRA
uniref:Uncharacterized protein n=1 Tax=Setaria italica TaxID=4555 RepID=K3Y413_SETIT